MSEGDDGASERPASPKMPAAAPRPKPSVPGVAQPRPKTSGRANPPPPVPTGAKVTPPPLPAANPFLLPESSSKNRRRLARAGGRHGVSRACRYRRATERSKGGCRHGFPRTGSASAALSAAANPDGRTDRAGANRCRRRGASEATERRRVRIDAGASAVQKEIAREGARVRVLGGRGPRWCRVRVSVESGCSVGEDASSCAADRPNDGRTRAHLGTPSACHAYGGAAAERLGCAEEASNGRGRRGPRREHRPCVAGISRRDAASTRTKNRRRRARRRHVTAQGGRPLWCAPNSNRRPGAGEHRLPLWWRGHLHRVRMRAAAKPKANVP